MPNKRIASYLRRLANWLDPPQALNVFVKCDASQAIAALEDLQKNFQAMIDGLKWEVECRKE
jgi:hypothetical protein